MAARGGGPVIMEHLLLEVAAAPLRLIAAKNEKSRSELGRFLVKQVREGAGGKELGRPHHRLARAPWPCAKTQGTGERRLVTLARSPRLVSGGGVRAHLRSLLFFCGRVFPSRHRFISLEHPGCVRQT